MSRKIPVCSIFLLFVLSAWLRAQFARTYGRPGEDSPARIATTPDGGMIFYGSWGGGPYYDQDWLVKLANDGTVQWEKTYLSGNGSRHAFCLSPDGGYLVAVGDSLNISLAKVGEAGNSYSWPPLSVCPAGSSGFFVIGSTQTGSDTAVWVLKLALDGGPIWQKSYNMSRWEYGLLSAGSPPSSSSPP
jgi:hypothetical protein